MQVSHGALHLLAVWLANLALAFESVAIQPPRMANPGLRDANLAAQGLAVPNVNGRRRVSKLNAVNDRPAKPAKCTGQ